MTSNQQSCIEKAKRYKGGNKPLFSKKIFRTLYAEFCVDGRIETSEFISLVTGNPIVATPKTDKEVMKKYLSVMEKEVLGKSAVEESYKLTDSDYLLLYPLLSPAKISEIFKEQAKSARYVQMLYKSSKLVDVSVAMDNLYKRSFAIASLDVDEYQWDNAFLNFISNELCSRLEIIRNRAEKYKELFKE